MWRRKSYPMPMEVRDILYVLTSKGHEAYVVGGCVRDMLSGREPKDWDVTTSARPETVERLMRDAGYTVVPQVGEAFAVTIVKTKTAQYEVATFRGERYGTDSHRPEAVYYADSLAEDVARRDFTVNAMALSAQGELYDFYNGKKDLAKRRLQTVGEPKERFYEDALRLFRACRFVAELDLLPTRELCRAMPTAFERVAGLSLDRVRNEVERILVAPKAARGLDLLVRSGLATQSVRRREKGRTYPVALLPELVHLPDTVQACGHRYDAWIHTLIVVEHTPPHLIVRWGALFHDVAKGLPGIRDWQNGQPTDHGHDRKGAEMARAVLYRWGYTREITEAVAFIVEMHMKYHYFVNHERADVPRWLRKLARSGRFRRTADLALAMERLGQVCVADVIGCGRTEGAINGHVAFAEYVAEQMKRMPIHTRDLRYPPTLPTYCGEATGKCLRVLLQRVQDGGLDNEPAVLMEAAIHYLNRQEKDV